MIKLFILITVMVWLSNCSFIRDCDKFYLLDESQARCKDYQELQWETMEKRFWSSSQHSSLWE